MLRNNFKTYHEHKIWSSEKKANVLFYRSSLCNQETLGTKNGHCYLAAAFVLAAKVPCILKKLQPHTSEFIKTLVANNRLITDEVCNDIPNEIRENYEQDFTSGGKPFDLMEAILIANGISYEWGQADQKIDFHIFNGFTEDYVKKRVFGSNTAIKEDTVQFYEFRVSGWAKNIGVSVDNFRFMIEKNPSRMLMGGILRLKSIKKKKTGEHGSHAVAFTMCEGRMLLCNFGSCTYDDTRTTSYKLREVALLFCYKA